MSADVWEGIFVVAAGALALAGSAAQAWGDLRKYRQLVDESKGIALERMNHYLAKFVGRDTSNWFVRLAQLASLPAIAASRDPSLLASGADKVNDEAWRKVKQALNDAAGWGLILVGALLAVVAGAVQLIIAVLK